MAEKVMTEKEYRKVMESGVFLKGNVKQNAGDPTVPEETPIVRLERQGLPVPEELKRTYE